MTADEDYSDDPDVSRKQEEDARELNRYFHTLSSRDQSHLTFWIKGFRSYLSNMMMTVTLRGFKRWREKNADN